MSKKEKRKILVLFAGMLVIMVIFCLLMILLEKRMPEETIADAGFLAENTFSEEKEKSRGSVLLGDTYYDYYHEYETYLLIGTDNTGVQSTETYQGSMSDFLLLAVVDWTADSYSFLPINRDTMSEITLLQKDGTGEATAELQICTAHWYGGSEEQSCENTVDAVSKLLGNIPINGYYCLPMDAIPKLNHVVGGVEVTVLEDFTKVDKSMAKGTDILLSDSQAYHYIHDRYRIGDEENVSRMGRQKQYMQALLGKIKKRMKEDKTFVHSLYQELEENAVTNITGKKASQFTNAILQGEQKGFYELEGESKMGQALGDGIQHVEFYVNENSRLRIMKQLYGLRKRNGD